MEFKKVQVTHVILFLYIWSKFFYFAPYQVSDFNITLSDICLLLMFISILTKKVDFKSTYIRIIFISLLIGLIVSIGSILQGTLVISGLVIFMKRWLTLLIIPIYMYLWFKKENLKMIIYFIIATIFAFVIYSFDALENSLGSTRLFDSFNPNVLGMVMSIILLFFISYNMGNTPRILKYIMVFISFIFIMAVSSRGALFALIPILLLYYFYNFKRLTYKFVFLSILFLIVILISYQSIASLIEHLFPYSYNRIFNTLYYGIFNDASASARLNTQVVAINVMFSEIGLLFFGTGFGNHNMFLLLSQKGYIINTADNMFVDIFVWCGLLGFLFFSYIFVLLLKRIIKSRNNPLRNTMILITLYVLLAGLTQDTLIEPTIGSFYFIVLGMFEIYNIKEGRLEK